MRHWADRLWELEDRRLMQTDAHRRLTEERRQHLGWARQLWQRLAVASRLARLPCPLVAGRSDRAAADLVVRLRHADGLLAQPGTARLLARNGFGPDERQELRQTLDLLEAAPPRLLEGERGLRATTSALLVIRGALVGDLARLSRLAGLALGAEDARKMNVYDLLKRFRHRRRPRRQQPDGGEPAAPAEGPRDRGE